MNDRNGMNELKGFTLNKVGDNSHLFTEVKLTIGC